MTPELRHLFQPGQIGRLVLPHRVVMGPMHLGLEARDDDGAALAAFYAERVRGGAGLIVTGGAAVGRAGAGGARYGVLTDRAFQHRLSRVVDTVHEAGGLIALQLFHAGRYAVESAFGLRPVAPSPVYSRLSRCEPRELSTVEIAHVADEFAAGAELAQWLEFDAVEVMGSEGYLIDQVLRIRPEVDDRKCQRRDTGFDHPRSPFSVAARRSMACPTASRPMRVTVP